MAKRLCFWLSMLGALALGLLCVAGAVAGPATSTKLFARALAQTVDAERIGVTGAELDDFAQETMHYLTGAKAEWEPQISLNGLSAQDSISPAFRAHMATVRGWVSALPAVFFIGVFLALNLWAFPLFAGGFSRRGAMLGAGMAGALVLAVLLWAILDFNGLWMLLHTTFIPDGIFPAGEPVMQLFPETLFSSYLVPVGIALVLHTAVLLLLIRLLWSKFGKGKML